MLVIPILIIALISIVWAIWSYKRMHVVKEVSEAKKELATGKVIFQDSSGESSSSSI
jgi:hypothetical protein